MTNLTPYLTRAVLDEPHRLSDAAWAGHIPFAFWLIENLAPRRLVELGTHTGNSYSAFCQAIAAHRTPCEAFAVDTWQGDAHAGQYGDEVYGEFSAYHHVRYASFSTLLRMTFDEAQPSFADGSIDLLHIDGLHTYEAVLHDFSTWRRKLSPRGVVLFHDIAVRRDDFGVHRLWGELSTEHPHFEFLHCNGLGVLGVGADLPAAMQRLFQTSGEERSDVRLLFDRLGQRLVGRLDVREAERREEEARAHLETLSQHHTAAVATIGSHKSHSEDIERHLQASHAEIAALRREIAEHQEERSAEVRELARHLDAAATEVGGLRHELATRLAEAAQRLSAAQADAAALRHELATRLAEAAQRVSAAQADAAALRNQLVRAETARAETDTHVAELSGQLTAFVERTAAPRWLARQLLWSLRERARETLAVARAPNASPSAALATTATATALSPSLEAVPGVPPPLAPSEPAHPRFLTVVRTHNLGRIDHGCAANGVDLRDLLAAEPAPRSSVSAPVDVIIPVYGGFASTRACIESALASRAANACFGRLIVVDDCGPDPDLRRWLQELPALGVDLIVNAENRGFVRSVNRAMRDAGDCDVVLLNSDTLVANDWLDRLAAHAREEPTIATVTPLSNNATICSFPDIGAFPGPPEGLDAATVDAVAARTNSGRRVDLPTGVGFCMFIARACLDDVGLFDEETWGRGYGEETDFCCRALAKGWRHVLAGDVYVFHEGSVSFAGAADALRERAQALMRALHPLFEPSVARWLENDPARPLRLALLLALEGAREADQTILHVTHPWGGGTERQIAQLVELTSTRARHLVLTVEDEAARSCTLHIRDGANRWRAFKFETADAATLTRLLAAIPLTRLHVHHTLGAHDALRALIAELGLPYDLSVHDYALVCPRTNLARDGRYCGEPDEAGCLTCLADDPPARSHDIIWWRIRGRQVIEGAERVICPSADVANRILRYAPDAVVVVAPHEEDLDRATAAPHIAALGADTALRVACLGIFAVHKGGEFLLETIEATRRARMAIEWRVIGDFPEALRARALALGVAVTGGYAGDEIGGLIAAADPHLVFFPQHLPETYSFTLSEALAARRAVLVPGIGAFTERVAGRAASWVYALERSPQDVARVLERIRDAFLAGAPGTVQSDSVAVAAGHAVATDFYRRAYLAPQLGVGAAAAE